jgi:hypothetical protein
MVVRVLRTNGAHETHYWIYQDHEGETVMFFYLEEFSFRLSGGKRSDR